MTTVDGVPFHVEPGPSMKVPTFYSIPADSDIATFQMMWTSFSIAALFGAIHCAGWSAKIHFSSHIASLLWRISSTFITVSPFIWSGIFVLAYAEKISVSDSFLGMTYDILGTLFVLFTIFTIPFYIFSRIILLGLAFAELRAIPPGALGTIAWANVLPFIH